MTLPARSSNLGLVAILAALAAGGCARAPQSATTIQGAAPSGTVGYVHMSDLVKKHPLYGQLAHFDQDIFALQLRSVGPQVAHSGADLARETRALQRELDAAAAATQRALQDKQGAYAKREQAAINAAIAASGGHGPCGAQIQSQMQATFQQQANAVTQQAQKNVASYQRSLIEQNKAAIQALARSLNERAQRLARAKHDELTAKEATLTAEQAQQDSAERLSLRTRLSNLALDEPTRQDVRSKLDAIDRKEADALAAMRNRDDATERAYQAQLRADTQATLDREAGAMRTRMLAKINGHELQARNDVTQQVHALPGMQGPAQSDHVTVATQGLPPDLRAKLQQIHSRFQADYNKDARATLEAFDKTRRDLSLRFAKLQGVDVEAQTGARKQLDGLQKQRSELYGLMVAQIGREVKTLAEKRGINVVFSDVVAPAGGVDLTADAEKDIESLH